MLIARQPIFDMALNVYGYELLYRAKHDSTQYDGVDSFLSTLSVISTLFENGINKVVNNKKAFVNFDELGLLSGAFELMTPKHFIIEILEDVQANDKVLERVLQLKNMGYRIAMDDFNRDLTTCKLAFHSDIIKYDLLSNPFSEIKEQVKIAKEQGKILLAEKVENQEMFLIAKEMGFDLFQGFFFSRPKNITTKQKKPTTRNQYVRILDELNQKEPCFQKLAEIIEKDPSLSYLLLRVIGTKESEGQVYSIKRALTYMGLNELKQWISILMIQDFCKKPPSELVRIALLRSKFAELIIRRSRMHNLKFEASLLGLFSEINAILEMDMKQALRDIPLSDSIKLALINEKGPLAPILKLIKAYECGDFNHIKENLQAFNMNEQDLLDDYLSSIDWADAIVMLL